MKRKLAALVLALLFLCGLVTVHGSLSPERSQAPGPTFAISEYGTLLDLFDAHGKSCFGKIVGDGFDVRYKIRGGTVAVSAIGTKTSGLQRGQVKLEGQSATASTMTEDQALEITSYFIFDENAKELIIGRKFRNVSLKPLTLQIVRTHVDSKLPPSTQSADVLRQRIKGSLHGPGSDCQELRKCLPPQCPGRTCLTQLPGEKGDVILEWKQGITLAPGQQKSHADALPLAANEAFIVIRVSLR